MNPSGIKRLRDDTAVLWKVFFADLLILLPFEKCSVNFYFQFLDFKSEKMRNVSMTIRIRIFAADAETAYISDFFF